MLDFWELMPLIDDYEPELYDEIKKEVGTIYFVFVPKACNTLVLYFSRSKEILEHKFYYYSSNISDVYTHCPKFRSLD